MTPAQQRALRHAVKFATRGAYFLRQQDSRAGPGLVSKGLAERRGHRCYRLTDEGSAARIKILISPRMLDLFARVRKIEALIEDVAVLISGMETELGCSEFVDTRFVMVPFLLETGRAALLESERSTE